MTSDYKKYSLEKLQEWVHDAMNSDASPHEIYSAIREAVREDYYCYKHHCSRAYGLLELLSGHRPVADADMEKAKQEYLESMYPDVPEDGSPVVFDYDAAGAKFPRVCDKDDPSPECQKSWNDFWEENYYPEEHKDSTVSSVEQKNHSEHYFDYTRNDPNRKNPFETKNGVTHSEYTKAKIEANSAWNDGWTKQHYQKIVDKYEGKQPKKWILPVEQSVVDGVDDYYVQFPDDLLEAANLKEGDQVEWIDQGDGSYLIKKVPMTYDEMIAAGWTMTADGFWIKE